MLYLVKTILKSIVANFYMYFGFVNRAKKTILEKNHIVSIYFHNPSLKTFNDCMYWLIKNNVDFIHAGDLLNEQTLPIQSNKIKVIVTVDDGWRENLLNIIPIAHFNKIPITIFLSTEPLIEGGGYWWSYIKVALKRGLTACTVPFLKTVPNNNRLSIVKHLKSFIKIERESMTVQELKSIAASPYIQIGAHTVTHPILTNCNDEQAATEIIDSKSILDAMLPNPVNSFSYPNGDHSEREVDLLKKNGYQLAFTNKPGFIKTNCKMDPYRLPRFEVLDNAPLNENICRMLGVWFKN
jgi:peptidoglycan/xylan/chitin deacetylase (PgdA/CDA1 family)